LAIILSQPAGDWQGGVFGQNALDAAPKKLQELLISYCGQKAMEYTISFLCNILGVPGCNAGLALQLVSTAVAFFSFCAAVFLGLKGYHGIKKQITENQNSYYVQLSFDMYKQFYSKEMLYLRAKVAGIPFRSFSNKGDLKAHLNDHPSHVIAIDKLLTFFELTALNFFGKQSKGKAREIQLLLGYYACGYWMHCSTYIEWLNEQDDTDFYYCNYRLMYEAIKDISPFSETHLGSFLNEEKAAIDLIQMEKPR
jgi:hypothetical protein